MFHHAEITKILSIVIPTYKSEANLPSLIERLENVLSEMKYKYEIIFVNDNSPDNTMSVLRKFCSSKPAIKVVSLSRNFGQQLAISAGLKYASGDAVIIMDDDLQDPPEFIPALIRKWEEGYEIVYAIRKTRQESFVKKNAYRLFYSLLLKLSHINIPKDSGDFGLMDRKIVAVINEMPERDRFVRGLRAWVGFKQSGLEYDREARFKGEPAYNLRKMIKLSLDGLLSFSNVPIKLSSAVGLAVSGIAFLGFMLTLFQKILTYYFHDVPFAVLPGFSTIVLSILFLGGVQLLSIGILGEYIGRIYNEVKQRPLYLVSETIGFKKPITNDGADSQQIS
jgi:dolichol-phosphate mannosyltransferase